MPTAPAPKARALLFKRSSRRGRARAAALSGAKVVTRAYATTGPEPRVRAGRRRACAPARTVSDAEPRSGAVRPARRDSSRRAAAAAASSCPSGPCRPWAWRCSNRVASSWCDGATRPCKAPGRCPAASSSSAKRRTKRRCAKRVRRRGWWSSSPDCSVAFTAADRAAACSSCVIERWSRAGASWRGTTPPTPAFSLSASHRAHSRAGRIRTSSPACGASADPDSFLSPSLPFGGFVLATQVLRFGHSPDPDDAFMFYGFATGAVQVRDYRVEHVLEDIESLNRRALTAELEMTAVSAHAYAHLADRYWVMRTGASVGRGYGPLIVAREEMPLEALAGKKVALPGAWTTAALVFGLLAPQTETVQRPFDGILDDVAQGRVDAGVIIHEGQLTFAEHEIGRASCRERAAVWVGARTLSECP